MDDLENIKKNCSHLEESPVKLKHNRDSCLMTAGTDYVISCCCSAFNSRAGAKRRARVLIPLGDLLHSKRY